MTMKDRVAAFLDLKNILAAFLETDEGEYASVLNKAAAQAQAENAWFTEESIRQALMGICTLLDGQRLTNWAQQYSFIEQWKKVACILAGNLPMVGFHDMLCVLLSGHHFIGKLSSKDSRLLSALAQILQQRYPYFNDKIQFVENLKGITYDAVIATGSNNSARYFQHYFGAKPHIIRKGHSSLAILSGKETQEQFSSLADDVFMYFGLGCRSVSKIYIPKGFDIRELFPAFERYNHYKNHHKWMNNYDYCRSVNMVNQIPFYETGFALFQEQTTLVSPIATVYYEYYDSFSELHNFLISNNDKLQCVVSNIDNQNFVPLGKAQFPEIADYADGVDTMAFLEKI